jgi:hypothetical protein
MLIRDLIQTLRSFEARHKVKESSAWSIYDTRLSCPMSRKSTSTLVHHSHMPIANPFCQHDR